MERRSGSRKGVPVRLGRRGKLRENLKGPFPQIKIVPTGGVSVKTAADFIKAGASALGVGTDLVDVKAIRAGEAHIVTERAKQFIGIIREAREAE